MISKPPSTRGLGITALLLLWAASAVASPEYPTAVQEAAGSPCPPPCTLCHETTNGGFGTATKPFAESMINDGLEGEDISLVAPAIEALRANQIDSDDDGVGDIAELASGRDPNLSGGGDLCGPQYGCGAQVASAPAVGVHALALALAGAALLGARLRRRRSAARGVSPSPGRQGLPRPPPVAPRRRIGDRWRPFRHFPRFSGVALASFFENPNK